MKADFIRQLNSNSSLARMLSYYEVLLGDYRYLTSYINVIDKITPLEIMQTAKKYFNKENRTVATLISRRTPSNTAGQSVDQKMKYEK